MEKLFDDEWSDDLSEFEVISIEDLNKGIFGTGKDPFEAIRTSKTFDEISNEYALSTPFGKNSAFYKPTIEDYDSLSKDFYTGGINYELLAKDLKEKLGLINDFLFVPEKYLLEDITIYSGTSSFGVPVMSNVKNNKPFLYNKNDREVQATFDLAKLNVRKNLLSNSYNFGIYFDNYKITYNLNFIYKDGEDKKFQDSETRQTSNPTDFKLNDEYIAIKLYTSNVDVFIEFLRIVFGNSDAESIKKSVIHYYRDFFATTKSNPDIIDALYENIPDFVLEILTDEMLWKDFVSLSEKAINSSGTNENLSIINLLKGVKNANWWYNQINNNPEPIRKVFEKFSDKHIDELIASFSRIGLKNWTNKELEQAWKFDIDYKEYKPSDRADDPYIRYTGFAYYLEKDKKYRIGTALFGYDNSSIIMPYNEKEIGNKIEMPFSPMKLILEGGKELYIPCFVAEYLTNKKIDEELWIVLNNIAAGLLPEIEAKLIGNILKNIKQESELLKKLRKFTKIKNTVPNESMPIDGKLYGIVEVENGLLKIDGQIIPKYGSVDFVITTEGKLLLGKKHHFLGNAQDVLAAGTLKIVKGKVLNISNFSGHYVPSIDEAKQFPEIFKVLDIDLEKAYLETMELINNKPVFKTTKIK